MTIPTPGLYRHYKGGTYRIIGSVRHTDTGEELILYRGQGWYADLGIHDPYFVRSLNERYKPAYDDSGNECERYTVLS